LPEEIRALRAQRVASLRPESWTTFYPTPLERRPKIGALGHEIEEVAARGLSDVFVFAEFEAVGQRDRDSLRLVAVLRMLLFLERHELGIRVVDVELCDR